MFGEEIVKKSDDFITKLTNDITTIKQFKETVFEYRKFETEFFEDLTSGKEISQYRIFDNDKESADAFNNFVKELQTNFLSLYNKRFSISELLNISEEIKELYTIFEANEAIDQLLKDKFNYSKVEFTKEEKTTIKDILDSLPFEAAKEIYPTILDFFNLLQKTTTLEEICANVSDVAKAANGFVTMNIYTAHNFMYLFVDDYSEVDRILKELKDEAMELVNMIFNNLEEIIAQPKTFWLSYNELMEFEYIKEIIKQHPGFAEIFDFITEVTNEVEKKYSLAQFDKILEEAINEATRVDRQAQKEVVIAYNVTDTVVGKLLITVVAVFVVRRKSYRSDKHNETKLGPLNE